MTIPDNDQFMNDFSNFIEACPTSYHTVERIQQALEEAGFIQLKETQPWEEKLRCGFVKRDGAVIAWRAPDKLSNRSCLKIVGTHTDSPALKLKPNPKLKVEDWKLAGVEIYGGPLLNSWLDRELGLAGRLVTNSGELHLVETGPIMRVPQLAPHLDRSVNEKLSLDKQLHLQPIYGAQKAGENILEYLCNLANIDFSQLAYYDIYTFPTEKPAVFGVANELFAAKRLDNLSSVFPGMQGFLHATETNDIQLLACFDHEEVGSQTRSGASGPFLSDVIGRILATYQVSTAEYYALLSRSSCISADAGHLFNPNYANYYDPVNRPGVNNGPLLKINAQQRYATDAIGAQIFLKSCQDAGVPWQPFVSNNAVSCGTTIGPLTTTRLGITTVDVGIGLLGMHSTREMCGTLDPRFLAKALQAYFVG